MSYRPPRPRWMPSKAPLPAPKKLERAALGTKALGYELTIVREHGRITEAVRLLYGYSKGARGEADERAALASERIMRALDQCDTEDTKRGVMAVHVYLCAELRAHAINTWRAQGPEIFFGRQHDGVYPIPHKNAGKRRHLRKKNERGEHQQGGLAEKLDRSTRQVYRYWEILRKAQVWDQCIPPRNRPDALLNRRGTQVYAQRWLWDGAPPQALLDQLPYDQLEVQTPPRRTTALTFGERRLRARELQRLADRIDYGPDADIPF